MVPPAASQVPVPPGILLKSPAPREPREPRDYSRDWQIYYELLDAFKEPGNENKAIEAVAAVGNVDAQLDNDRTPLHQAVVFGYSTLLDILLDRKASLMVYDDQGCTPLDLASIHGHLSVVRKLLAKGAKVDQEKTEGWTPLHHALQHGHEKIAVELLQHGADPRVKTKGDCLDAFDRAMKALNAFEVLRLLGTIYDSRDNLDQWLHHKLVDHSDPDVALFLFSPKHTKQLLRDEQNLAVADRQLTVDDYNLSLVHRAAYKYDHLVRDTDDKRRPTRLVSFNQSSAVHDYAMITIDIKTYPAGTQKYTAISYTWGDATPTHRILCDSGASCLTVTKSLYQILLSLRNRSNGHQKYWIDAICIDQANTSERNHEVRRMAKIYHDAEEVLVLLSTDSVGPASAVRSPWWSRRWVIQEVLAAQRVAVQSGESEYLEIGWDTFIGSCLRHLEELSADALSERTLRNTKAKIQELQSVRYRQPLDIFTLLNHFESTECKDPRDRLYAFISISRSDLDHRKENELLDSLERMPLHISDHAVNYERPVDQVYLQFGLTVLKSTRPVRLLHCAGAFRSDDRMRNARESRSWPSWLPDWRTPRRYRPLMTTAEFVPLLDFRQGLEIQIDEANKTVSLRGYSLGVIQTIVTPPSPLAARPVYFYVSDASEPGMDITVDRVEVLVHTSRRGIQVAYVPRIVSDGNIVVALVGASTPFVLRQKTAATFILICDSYIPAMMARNGQRARFEQKLETFVLV